MDSAARTLHAGTSGRETIAEHGMSIATSEPKFPFPIQTKEWYTLALLGNASTFQLHVKRQGELVFQKVSEWADLKNLHPKGVLGFHTNQLQHYYIDNLYLYDSPNQVSLAVESYGKLAVTWAGTQTVVVPDLDKACL